MKKLIIKSGLLLVAASMALFFWSDIKNVVASPEKSKTKKEKKIAENRMSSASQLPLEDGISIVRKWDLPDVLKEISGLSYIGDDRFLCVQDELGTLFIYNTASGSIEKEIPFGSAGDYEGVAVVDQAAWVVRADGRLYEVSGYNSGKPSVKEYSTHLNTSYNVEGLCYDKTNQRLLVAIKDDEPGRKDYKGVYAFDLGTRKMPVEPVIKINLTDKIFEGASGKKGKDVISPSAIAINPQSGDIYITDGKKSRLLIMDEKGNLKSLHQLSTSEFAQPEGITFKPTGEIYISNEGPKKPANILLVKYAG